MYCRKCGANNADNAIRCVQCGEPMQPGQSGQPSSNNPYNSGPRPSVPNYLVHAILTTLFCCLPLGIVSIVFAAQVDSKLNAGDYAGAVDASNKAKTWAMWGFGLGLLGIIFYIVVVVLFGVLGDAAGTGY